ncbi:MAG TPA: VOC family protein [Dongiaceae bacterium]|nr:VOC family protein [Dongiaceae bacterium]
MQTIFPILRYNDARGAIRWLCSAFGFVQVFSVPENGGYVRHAQLKLGKNLIMVGSVRLDDGIVSPKTLGTATQMLAVYVEDPDGHFARAQAAGAKILYPPRNTDFGSREYHVADLEGHLWTFGTYRPSADDGENS